MLDQETFQLCRYEKRHSNFSAHCSPAFRVREGDTVVCGQCRSEAQGLHWLMNLYIFMVNRIRHELHGVRSSLCSSFTLPRPLSKTVRFNVIRVTPSGASKKG